MDCEPSHAPEGWPPDGSGPDAPGTEPTPENSELTIDGGLPRISILIRSVERFFAREMPPGTSAWQRVVRRTSPSQDAGLSGRTKIERPSGLPSSAGDERGDGVQSGDCRRGP